MGKTLGKRSKKAGGIHFYIPMMECENENDFLLYLLHVSEFPASVSTLAE